MPHDIAALVTSMWGPEQAAVEQVIERELAQPDTDLTRALADEPGLRMVALAAYRQGLADEREKWEPPF